jgi:streptogramin lyase
MRTGSRLATQLVATRLDPVSRHVVVTIPVGGSPNGIAATADGIWVTVD